MDTGQDSIEQDRFARDRGAREAGQARPVLGDLPASGFRARDVSARTAADAIERFVAGLQDGADSGDADVYDGQFASDVLWGSPYGATVQGYATLNGLHRMLMAAGTAPPSRFEVVQTLNPMPGVVIAQIRRSDLTAGSGEGFSEMAMYVLVERDGQWWLAAAQNTPIVERPA
jgi:uncharacterized protein (TIGR02246 family)